PSRSTRPARPCSRAPGSSTSWGRARPSAPRSTSRSRRSPPSPGGSRRSPRLVARLGCDPHHSDPLAMLALTTSAYRETAAALHRLAHEAAGGRWLATGGGGYQWARVVPRAWTIYFAEMAGVDIPDELPEPWIEAAEREAGGPVPDRLSEP